LKPTILLLIKVPPPVTGATLMNQRVRDSVILNEVFDIHIVEMSYATTISDLGSFRLNKFLLFFRYLFKLVKKLVTVKYDFAYFQISPHGSAFFRDMVFVLILKLSSTKIVYHLRGKGIKHRANKFFYYHPYKFAFRSESIIVLSNLLKFDVEDVHYGRIFIVPNAIPDIKLLKHKNHDLKRPLNILFLSNLHYTKGINDYIKAVKLLVEKKLKLNAIIVGAEGDYTTKKINQLISNNNLNGFLKYLGPKYDEAKYEIFNSTDLLIYPTLEDIWGNVNLEAMQHGVPIIATREGAIPEIIDDGITGFLVEKNRPDQIASRIEVLYNDRELLNQMGIAARRKYEAKYRLEIFEQNMKNVFMRL
jgi:glycosyltransferase involved in cell wall biosynthesis